MDSGWWNSWRLLSIPRPAGGHVSVYLASVARLSVAPPGRSRAPRQVVFQPGKPGKQGTFVIKYLLLHHQHRTGLVIEAGACHYHHVHYHP